MSHFTLIDAGLHVEPLLEDLDRAPDIWNHEPGRRMGDSPHRETDDIWLRYNDPRVPFDPRQPHISIWYPVVQRLPGLWPIVDRMYQKLEPKRAGGVLITRIPPGKQVYPHDDRGPWHAEHYTTKVWIPLRSNAQCVNAVEEEAMVWKPGEAWSHDNLLTHSVVNGGETERICLILCFRL